MIVDFEGKHLDEIELREFDALYFDRDRLLNISKVYPTKTVMLGGKIAAIFGVFPIAEGSYEMWSVTGKQVDKYPIAYHKTAKRVIETTIDKFKLSRLQLICLTEYEKSKKWLHRLGFRTEGILRKYDAKNDYYMMSRVQ